MEPSRVACDLVRNVLRAGDVAQPPFARERVRITVSPCESGVEIGVEIVRDFIDFQDHSQVVQKFLRAGEIRAVEFGFNLYKVCKVEICVIVNGLI